MMNLIAMNLCNWKKLTVVLILISLNGCATFRPDRWYMYNSVDDKLTEKAQSNWTPAKANLWLNLLKNQKLTSNAELHAQRSLQEAIVSSHHIEIINSSWLELLENLNTHQKELDKELIDLEKDQKKALVDKTKVGKIIEELIIGCRFKYVSASDNDEVKKYVQAFKSNNDPKKEECAVLIVNSPGTTDDGNWTIAGFDKKVSFKEKLIDDPNSDLIKELKMKPADNNKIVKLVTQKLGLITTTRSREEALKVAQEDQWRWQAELILFEKATQGFLLQQAIKNREIEGVEPKNTKEIFEEILKETITTTDASGKDIQKPIEEVLPKEKVSLIKALSSSNDLSGWGPFLRENGKQLDDVVTTTPPPGITFQILSLGAELAKATLNREKAIKNRLDEEILLFSKRQEEITQALKLIKQTKVKLSVKEFNRTLPEIVSESIQNSLGDDKASPDSEGLIDALQTYVIASDYFTLSDNSFGISKAALLHYYAIEDSAISAREHEALIQSGLETLAVYHSGGITQEEINSILQAVQAVALGVISAGVF